MENKIRIVMAQLNLLVGDIEGNTGRIIKAAIEARDKMQADLIAFPELSITSYPPEDLLLRPNLYVRVNQALERIMQETKGIDVIVGYPAKAFDGYYNKAAWLRDGEIIGDYHKQHLPNYGVFDERRYFKPGSTPCIVKLKNIPIAMVICEDLWHPGPMEQAVVAGAKLLISINGSPFHMNKRELREELMSNTALFNKMPIVYLNLVGGQDELIFDGGSLVLAKNGSTLHQAPFYEETLMPVDFEYSDGEMKTLATPPFKRTSMEEHTYNAIVLGVRDYIEKNHFPSAAIGLSGGIDSALTLAIAVDAIGADRVHAVLMPSRYTSDMSIEDAELAAKNLGVKHTNLSIEPMYESCLDTLKPEFRGLKPDTTEENIQARIRGLLLMAISNKKGGIVLSTGNKSEMAVGYSTLYGDMAGGFCVLKDVPKTIVYRLAKYRNGISPVIPQRIIDRPPSAELTEDQLDQDNLPPYDVLDAILERYIEQDKSPSNIIEEGFDADTVKEIVQLVDRNEYKRRQSPPGVRITQRAFGRDRRYPITSGYGKHFKFDNSKQ